MATETTTKLTGAEAIEAFAAAHRDGEGVKVWTYHHVQVAGGSTEWGSEDCVRELLTERVEGDFGYGAGTWESAEWDGESLDLSCSNGYRYSLRYEPTPDAGRERVAYSGAHAGFCWQGEFETPGGPRALRTLLEYLRWDDAELTGFGLACCEDYDCGDDGGYWLVDDAGKFAETLRKCRAFAETYDDVDDGSEEYEGDDVAEFLRTGVAPEWMRDGDGPGADR